MRNGSYLSPFKFLIMEENEELVKLQDENFVLKQAVRQSENIYKKYQEAMTLLKKKEKELHDKNEEIKKAFDTLQLYQNELVETQKLAALGGLVSGVAHEVNTPLGVGVTFASVIENETTAIYKLFIADELDEEEFKSYLERMKESSHLLLENLDKASALVKSFKQISVDQTIDDKRMFNLEEYLREILLTHQNTLKRIKVTTECPPSLMLDSYPGLLSQVFNNLIQNALLHAFNDTISTPALTIRIKDTPHEILFTFSDNGIGISPQTQAKIFEPFFTTARDKGGSGLGLSIIHNIIVGKLKGHLEVTSAPLQGTTFTMSIPKESH